MSTNTHVNDLKINKLKEAQFDAAVQSGIIDGTQLSIITDAGLSYNELEDLPDPIQVSTIPTAASTNLGRIVQYTGATDSTYTHGYIYECVSDGQSTPTYSWTRVDIQPAGSSLPSQTGNSGKFLTTDGTDASWADALTNSGTGTNSLSILGYASGKNSVSIGKLASASGLRSVSIGGINSGAGYSDSIAIGANAQAGANNAIQLGGSGSNMRVNQDANTFKVGNANGNFEIMSANGTIPEARLADTTNAAQGQALVLDSNLNAIWATVDGLPSQSGQSGKYLTTNGTSASWATISTTLSGLTDTTITSATSGQVLSYNGSAWVNSDPTPAMVIIDHTVSNR